MRIRTGSTGRLLVGIDTQGTVCAAATRLLFARWISRASACADVRPRLPLPRGTWRETSGAGAHAKRVVAAAVVAPGSVVPRAPGGRERGGRERSMHRGSLRWSCRPCRRRQSSCSGSFWWMARLACWSHKTLPLLLLRGSRLCRYH